MLRRSVSRSIRAAGLAGLLAAAIAAIAAAPAAAQALESDIAQDSELTLLERSDSGAYRRFLIRLTMSEGVARLTTDKDGVTSAVEISEEEALALWRDLAAEGFETIANPPPGKMLPDQSHFTVRFRVKEKTGGFSAYGVDSLSDKRYRQIVRAILKTADKQRPGDGGAL
jgi:hypothetical protein